MSVAVLGVALSTDVLVVASLRDGDTCIARPWRDRLLPEIDTNPFYDRGIPPLLSPLFILK